MGKNNKGKKSSLKNEAKRRALAQSVGKNKTQPQDRQQFKNTSGKLGLAKGADKFKTKAKNLNGGRPQCDFWLNYFFVLFFVTLVF